MCPRNMRRDMGRMSVELELIGHIFMKRLVLVSVVLLAACANPLKVTSSSERSVVVQALKASDAQNLANSECQRYGRSARLNGMLPGTIQYVFDCEK
jgi:hypothetical protein